MHRAMDVVKGDGVWRETANVFFGASEAGSRSALPDLSWLRKMASQSNIKGMEVTCEHDSEILTGVVEDIWVDENEARLLARMRFPVPKNKLSSRNLITELIKKRVLGGVSAEWTTFRKKDPNSERGKGPVLCQYLKRLTVTGIPKVKNNYICGYPTAASLLNGKINLSPKQSNSSKYKAEITYADIVASIESNKKGETHPSKTTMEQTGKETASNEAMEVESPTTNTTTNTSNHQRSEMQSTQEGLTTTHPLEPSNEATQVARDTAFKLSQNDWQAVQALNQRNTETIEKLSKANQVAMATDKKRLERIAELEAKEALHKSQGNSKRADYLKGKMDTILGRYRTGVYKDDPQAFMKFEQEMKGAIQNPIEKEEFLACHYAASLTVDFAEQEQQALRKKQDEERLQEENVRAMNYMQKQIKAMQSGTNETPIFIPSLGTSKTFTTTTTVPATPVVQQQQQQQQQQNTQKTMNSFQMQPTRKQPQVQQTWQEQVASNNNRSSAGGGGGDGAIEQQDNMASLTFDQFENNKGNMTQEQYFREFQNLYGFDPWGDDVEVVDTNASLAAMIDDIQPFARNIRSYQCAAQIEQGGANQKPWIDFTRIIADVKGPWKTADSNANL